MQLKKLLSILLATQLILVTSAAAVSYDNDLTEENSKIIDKRIKKGLHYLYESQLPSGEFPTYASFSPDISNGRNETVVFDTGFVLHTLSLTENKHTEKIVQEMKTRAIAFLLDNMETHGVWRFWGKSVKGLPPDTDDTAVVFAALVESGVNISDEPLDYMLNYTSPDGVFYTWINSEEWLHPSNPYYAIFKRNVTDANVNADVLYAYSLRNRTQSGVIRYLNDIAENKSFVNGTLFYPSPYVFTYLVTKAYSDGGVRELEPSLVNIRDYVLATQKPDGGWGNDLDTALATVSLLNTGYDGAHLDKAIEHILDNQSKNGSWSIYAFYVAPSPISAPIYYGSSELTTSFSLEALIKYNKMKDNDSWEE